MVYDFKPIKYKYLEKGDLVRLNYIALVPFMTLRHKEFVGFVENINPDQLRISMSNPNSGYIGFNRSKDLNKKGISNLRRLEVVLAEEVIKDDDIPF